MRQAFAHEAVLVMAAEQDERAPGAAITVELCGHWEHEPPCPLAPHHTATERRDERVYLRVLFAVHGEQEAEVRRRIDSALAAGQLTGPEGNVTHWRLDSSRPAPLSGDEDRHAARLIAG
jgi:hypothetical protein